MFLEWETCFHSSAFLECLSVFMNLISPTPQNADIQILSLTHLKFHHIFCLFLFLWSLPWLPPLDFFFFPSSSLSVLNHFYDSTSWSLPVITPALWYSSTSSLLLLSVLLLDASPSRLRPSLSILYSPALVLIMFLCLKNLICFVFLMCFPVPSINLDTEQALKISWMNIGKEIWIFRISFFKKKMDGQLLWPLQSCKFPFRQTVYIFVKWVSLGYTWGLLRFSFLVHAAKAKSAGRLPPPAPTCCKLHAIFICLLLASQLNTELT